MENIRVIIISTDTVRAATTKRERIELSANDLGFLLIGPIQRGLIFTKPKQPNTENLIQHLKTSLSRTLHFFFPLAGRFATHQHQNNTTCFFLDCNNAGVHFLHAVAQNISISDILQPLYTPPFIHSFFPLNGIKNHEGVSNPLLAVQVTELADGIFIGITVNHTVVDGTSFWHFINSWSEISRGSNHISQPPVFENWFRTENCLPISFPPGSVDKPTDNELITSSPLKERVFHFSKEKIAGLKERANSELGTEKISRLQSLLAHVWKWVTRSRQLDPDQDTYLTLIFNLRSRFDPPIPEVYFGNVIKGDAVAVKRRVLLENGIGYAALETNKLVGAYSKDKLKDSKESWINTPNLITLSFDTTNVMAISSSPRFNVYGNDFGWGRPIGVRSGPANKFDGLMIVYEGLEEGSMDIEVCSLPEVLQAMENDFEPMLA